MLACEQESGNPNDPLKRAAKYPALIIGQINKRLARKLVWLCETNAIYYAVSMVEHVPRKSSAACSLFLLLEGTICCEITYNQRRYSSDLPQGKLEIPC